MGADLKPSSGRKRRNPIVGKIVSRMSRKMLFSLPNILTYGRIVAVPMVVLCFFGEGKFSGSIAAHWVAVAIFALASITDFFDGYLARAWGQQSSLGRMLDPIADKLLVASCLLMLAAGTTIRGWALLDRKSTRLNSSH